MSEYDGCLVCTDVGRAWVGPILLLVVLLVCGLIAWFAKDRAIKWAKKHEMRLREEAIRATITFVTMQIVIIMNTTVGNGSDAI